jgi:serine/threonine protein kinase
MKNYDEERVAAAKNEFDLLKSFKHPNIVRVKEIFVTVKDIYILLKDCLNRCLKLLNIYMRMVCAIEILNLAMY